MIERVIDAGRINEIINHPDVLPWVALPGQGELDLSPLVADERNVLLMAEHGGFLFHWQEPAVYEVHTQFLPGHRGARMVKAAREALRWMFCRTDCMEVLTKCPVDHPGTAKMGRALGFVHEFSRPEAWRRAAGDVAVDYYALRYPGWVLTIEAADPLYGRGVWFHEMLEAEKRRVGRETPSHDDDFHHDLRVGLAVEMILGGRVDKGIILYNRWARFAGYQPLELLSRDPLVIDIRDGLIHVHDNTFEVI